MPGLIGKKIGMTSIFNEEGKNIPCTILEVGPCKVTQLKTVELMMVIMLYSLVIVNKKKKDLLKFRIRSFQKG